MFRGFLANSGRVFASGDTNLWIDAHDHSAYLIEVRGAKVVARSLVKNRQIFTTSGASLDANDKLAQAFTAGTHTAGYRLTSIYMAADFVLDASAAGSELTATLNQASGAIPGPVLCTLSDPASFSLTGLHRFTAPTTDDGACPTLKPTRTYFLVLSRSSGTSAMSWLTHARDEEDPGKARD